MQAIETKFLGATNSRGSRIKATSASGLSATIGYPHELNAEDAHRLAAETLCKRLNWTWNHVTGGLRNSYAHVALPNTPYRGS